MRVKELIKKTFLYKKYRKQKEKKYQEHILTVQSAFNKEAIDVLRLYSEALLNNGLVFWIDYGTLLGYYREKDFIKYDYDLDTSAWFEDHARIKEVLEMAGFERVRYYYLKNQDGMEECYKHRDYATTIDVFYYFNDGDRSYCFSFIPLVSMNKRHHLNKTQRSRVRRWTFPSIHPVPTVFKGVKIFVPENPGAYLAYTYGDTFMTPIPNYPIKGRPNLTEYSYEEMPAQCIMSVGYF